jgi:hypothetical protein
VAKKVSWTARAKADVRAIDLKPAMRILEGLARFLLTEEGDAIEILSVRHSSEAYR